MDVSINQKGPDRTPQRRSALVRMLQAFNTLTVTIGEGASWDRRLCRARPSRRPHGTRGQPRFTVVTEQAALLDLSSAEVRSSFEHLRTRGTAVDPTGF